jgi:CHAD domain-containing protein
VHEYRKRCKKVRALLRLFRPALGKTYSSENEALRDSARRLSDLRDATSMIETVDELADHVESDGAEDVLRALRSALENRRETMVARQSLEERLERCAADAASVLERVPSWSLDEASFDAMGAGVRKTYGRARKAMGRAAEKNSTKRWHEWRKRVKYHRYHVRLLRDAWRPVLDPWREELHALTDFLGDDHDLAVLRGALASDDVATSPDHRATLEALIDRRRAELQARAQPLGARLLAEPADAFVHRMSRFWSARHAESTLDEALT